MYLEFYGFKTKPFSLTPDPRFFYCSAVHKNVICDAALLAGYVEEEPQLNEEHIAMAVSHLGLQQATGNNEGQGQFLSAEQAPWSKTVRQLQDVCRLMEELYEKYTAASSP